MGLMPMELMSVRQYAHALAASESAGPTQLL
jgi:hypothetical protein